MLFDDCHLTVLLSICRLRPGLQIGSADLLAPATGSENLSPDGEGKFWHSLAGLGNSLARPATWVRSTVASLPVDRGKMSLNGRSVCIP
jgi:hypothetical protein